MKIQQSAALPPALAEESVKLGLLLLQLRQTRHLKQTEVTAWAGISRSSAYRIEWGDASVSLSQILRYLHAIAPDMALKDLLNQSSPIRALPAAAFPLRRMRSAGAEKKSQST